MCVKYKSKTSKLISYYFKSFNNNNNNKVQGNYENWMKFIGNLIKIIVKKKNNIELEHIHSVSS